MSISSPTLLLHAPSSDPHLELEGHAVAELLALAHGGLHQVLLLAVALVVDLRQARAVHVDAPPAEAPREARGDRRKRAAAAEEHGAAAALLLPSNGTPLLEAPDVLLGGMCPPSAPACMRGMRSKMTRPPRPTRPRHEKA